jgi:hypothetical protein
MDDTTAPAAQTDPSVAESVADLSARALAYARALKELVASEAALAKINLARLLIGALFLPALALGLVVAVDALLAAWLYALGGHWLPAIAVVVLCDLAALLALFWEVRKWWRSLSLPRSRAAITALWSSHDDAQTNRERAPALGAG